MITYPGASVVVVNLLFVHLCVSSFFITFGPQDLSRKLDRVGNMNFGTQMLKRVMQVSQHKNTDLLDTCVNGSVDLLRRLHDLFEHSPYQNACHRPDLAF